MAASDVSIASEITCLSVRADVYAHLRDAETIDKQREDLGFILDILSGEEGKEEKIGLWASIGRLKEAGESIATWHPLIYMAEIITNPVYKARFQRIFNLSLSYVIIHPIDAPIGRFFIKKLKDALKAKNDLKELIPSDYLPAFLKEIEKSSSLEQVQKLIKAEAWDDLIILLFSLPHEFN